MKTKKQNVVEYLQANGSITSLEAINEFYATRLAAIIYTLKKEGMIFRTTREKHKSGCYYARYSLIEKTCGNNLIDESCGECNECSTYCDVCATWYYSDEPCEHH